MSVLNAVIFVLLCFVLPIVLGFFVSSIVNKTEYSIAKTFLYGSFLIWSFIQLISVPLILKKTRFSILLIIYILFVVLNVISFIHKRHYLGIKNLFVNRFKNKKDRVFIILLACVSIVFLVLNISYQHIDEDDSRFVVNAVDILDKNTLFLTNPATGEDIKGFILDDSDKDICSPWAVYYALMSKVIGTSVVVFVHTLLPIKLICLAICVWWLVGEKLLGKNVVDQSMFVIFIILMYIFGYSHLWTQVTMFMDRLWQGKAVVSSIGIPALFVVLFDYYDNPDFRHLIPIFIVNIGMCLFSGMGIVIGAIIIGCFALGYTIAKRDLRMLLYILPLAIPNAIYYMLEMSI